MQHHGREKEGTLNNPFHIRVYGDRECYATDSASQLAEVRNMGIDNLKLVANFPGAGKTVKKAAASRLRRLQREASK